VSSDVIRCAAPAAIRRPAHHGYDLTTDSKRPQEPLAQDDSLERRRRRPRCCEKRGGPKSLTAPHRVEGEEVIVVATGCSNKQSTQYSPSTSAVHVRDVVNRFNAQPGAIRIASEGHWAEEEKVTRNIFEAGINVR
jgi:hypothetical protein